jgi:hypothetical protein
MLTLNPIVISHQLLPPESSAAFFASEAKEYEPAATSPGRLIPVYAVTESSDGQADSEDGGWRGGWAKRFIPEAITYETSMDFKEDGLLSITHAPMGVRSESTWRIREIGGGLVVEEIGKVTSNRMLMAFIKTTLQVSTEKLVDDFVAILEREAAGNTY